MRKVLLAILLTTVIFTACKKDDDKPSDNDTIEYFNANIKADLKYDDIINLFGQPDAETGSGIHIYHYNLNYGSMVFIGYADKIIYARHVNSSGVVLHTII